MQKPCLICDQKAEFRERYGKREREGIDDVCCARCGGYSIADEYKPLLKKALDSGLSLRDHLSFMVSSRYRSAPGSIVVEITPALLDEIGTSTPLLSGAPR